MYGEALGRRSVRPKINYIMIILFLIIIFFSIRVIGILKSNKERGGFVYVQLLNLGMPLVENQIYNEGAYAENKLSLKNVFIDEEVLNKRVKEAGENSRSSLLCNIKRLICD